ncbi:MAG: hypothetical protein K8S99_17155 [Planctomycetes bacterium]|nr:hypothetical protein [Planctomycetota bacterium]
MKSLRFIIVGFLVGQLLLLAIGAGWLQWTGRLDRDRMKRAYAMFKPTIATEVALAEEERKTQEEEKVKAAEAARLKSVSQGPVTLGDRLHNEQQADEIAMERVERLQADIKSLQQQIATAKAQLTRQRAELEAEKKQIEVASKATRDKAAGENFAQAVMMYEQLKPKQTKDMFRTLLSGGKRDEVVEYLASMQLRKAAAVLKEFKTPEEVVQATELVERLRSRGIDPVAGISRPVANPT